MKCAWQFFFETRGFRFQQRYRFMGLVDADNRKALDLPADVDRFFVEIEPDAECKFPTADQSGVLKVVLRGNPESTKQPVRRIVSNVAQQISYRHSGTLKIHSGLITGERIPETEDERQQVADRPYFAEAHVVEYEPAAAFDPASLATIGVGGPADVAMRQFNSAMQASNPVDRFLGFFKVLESIYCDGAGKQKTLAKLRASGELREIAAAMGRENGFEPTDEQYITLLKDLVQTRHRCAHLRGDGSFGFVPGTAEIRAEVEPLANIARKLADGAIQRRTKEAR